MRRNSRPMGRRQNSSRDSGGPLNINHLKDIDLELELLKRKREMIEQQQLLLIDQELAATRQFSYNNYSNNDYNRRFDDDFANDFSNNRFSDDNEFSGYRNQFGRKRPADPQWKNDFKKQPKKGRGSFTNYGNRSEPPPGQGTSGFAGAPRYPKPRSSQFKGPKANASFSNAPTFSSNKNFKPNKTTKPKPSPVPNKPATKSFEERPKPRQQYEAVDANILLPDREPSQQVAGRLELALGSIMKDIRLKHGLRSLQVQRLMKQTVRERIRSVMLGKVVGNMAEILAHYREEFPPDSDVDILNMAREAIGEQRITIVSDNPEEFFRKKITQLLDKTLKEMLKDIEVQYNKKNAEATTVEADETNTVSSEQTVNEKDEVNQQSQEQKEITGETVTKAEDSDEKALLSPTEGEQPTNEEQPVANEETPTKEEKPTTKDEKQPLGNIPLDKRTEKELEELYQSINPNIKRVMPRIVKNYIPYIIKLLNLDGIYKKEKAQIVKKTNELVAEQQKTGQEKENANASEDGTPTTSTPTKSYSPYNLPYYVKIMGRPTLPKRKAMQTFLDVYNPKSIKRHRAIHNLLFIGFTDKSDYEAIITADGTKIGRINLSIRTCEKQAQNDKKQADANTTGDSNKSCEINSDLDQQINDLFLAIRKEEENSFAFDDDIEMDKSANVEKDGQNAENNEGEEQSVQNGKDVIIQDGETETEILENEREGKGQETGDNVVETEGNANDVETVDENQTEPVQEPDNNANADANEDKEAPTEELSDKVSELKSVKATAPATPTRQSSRLASTPSSIRTRRASKLAQE